MGSKGWSSVLHQTHKLLLLQASSALNSLPTATGTSADQGASLSAPPRRRKETAGETLSLGNFSTSEEGSKEKWKAFAT